MVAESKIDIGALLTFAKDHPVIGVLVILAVLAWFSRHWWWAGFKNADVPAQIDVERARLEPFKESIRLALRDGGQVAASGPLRKYTCEIEALCGRRLVEFLSRWIGDDEAEAFLARVAVYNADWTKDQTRRLARAAGNVSAYGVGILTTRKRLSVAEWAELDWMAFVGREYDPYAS